MRRYSSSYLIGNSVRGFVRNGFMSAASVLILTSCLLVTGCFGLLIYNLYVNLNELDGLNEIVCMCEYDLSDERAQEIENELKTLENVTDVVFISKEEAFEQQKAQFAGFPKILDYFENNSTTVTNPGADADITDALPENDTLPTYETDENGYIILPQEENDGEEPEEQTGVEEDGEQTADGETETDGGQSTEPEDTDAPQTDAQTQAQTSASDTLTTVNNNPLSDAFKITYGDIEGVSRLRDRLSSIDGIRSVKDAAEAAQTLQSLKDSVMVVFIGFMAVLILISLIIIMNTVSMAINARSKEIIVMRYIGATSYFISLPFILEAVIIGLVSTLLAYGAQYAIYSYLARAVFTSDPELSSFIRMVPFSDVWLFTLLGYIVIATVTCFAGSKISLSRNIKV